MNGPGAYQPSTSGLRPGIQKHSGVLAARAQLSNVLCLHDSNRSARFSQPMLQDMNSASHCIRYLVLLEGHLNDQARFWGHTNAPWDSWARVKTQWPVFLSYFNPYVFLWWLSFDRARLPELSNTTGIISLLSFIIYWLSLCKGSNK